MRNNKERLDAIAMRISRMVNELPDENNERPLHLVIEGDNYGNITLSNHITIHAPSDWRNQEHTLTDADTAASGQDGDR